MSAFKRNFHGAVKSCFMETRGYCVKYIFQKSTTQKSLEKEELTPNSQSRMDKTQQNVLGNKQFYSEARKNKLLQLGSIFSFE